MDSGRRTVTEAQLGLLASGADSRVTTSAQALSVEAAKPKAASVSSGRM
jgi:hypothetical protein